MKIPIQKFLVISALTATSLCAGLATWVAVARSKELAQEKAENIKALVHKSQLDWRLTVLNSLQSSDLHDRCWGLKAAAELDYFPNEKKVDDVPVLGLAVFRTATDRALETMDSKERDLARAVESTIISRAAKDPRYVEFCADLSLRRLHRD